MYYVRRVNKGLHELLFVAAEVEEKEKRVREKTAPRDNVLCTLSKPEQPFYAPSLLYT